MKICNLIFTIALAASFTAASGQTPISPRTPAAASAPTAIPALVPFSGIAVASDGKPLTGEASITFLVYKDEAGGEPLWTESQIAVVDSTGHYKVQLGAANPNGLPSDLFESGEARWLEIQIAGETPQARILLASVPYALKAADAATLGGLPASAFALAGSKTSPVIGGAIPAGVASDAASNVTTPGGTSGYLPVFTGRSTVGDSILYSSKTGIGVGDVPNSSAVFDVNGKSIWRGLLNVSRSGNATTSTGYPSFAALFQGSVYNTSSKAALLPIFQLQVEPTGNNTANTGGTFNFLYNSNNGTPTETGLYFNANGTIHFASGQTFGSTSSSGVAVNGTSTSNTGVEGASGSGSGVYGTSTSGSGMQGKTAGTTLHTAGVYGVAGAPNTSGFTGIAGVWGDADAHVGVFGSSTQYSGVQGSSASNNGVWGQSTSSNGVYGSSTDGNGMRAYSGGTSGIFGETGSISSGDAALSGLADSAANGVIGSSNGGIGGEFFGGVSSGGLGQYGSFSLGGSSSGNQQNGGYGVFGYGGDAYGDASYGGHGGYFQGGYSDYVGGFGGYFIGGDSSVVGQGGYGIFVTGGNGSNDSGPDEGYSANFQQSIYVNGAVANNAQNVKIDDPADPANKYLVHSAVASSEQMNIYSGNVTTDELGLATVTLPTWFQDLNTDFRYQLTVVGGRFAQAIVSKEIDHNQFTISTNATSVKVSWQVTAVRQDAYAKAHPLVVEQAKRPRERGFYQHPELYSQPREKQTEWGLHPQMMAQLKAARIPRPAPVKSSPGLPRPIVNSDTPSR